RWRRRMMLAACVGIILVGGARTARWLRTTHQNGIGLTSRRWRESELIGRITNLDRSVPIVSNSAALIYLLTGRLTYGLPMLMNAETNHPTSDYDKQMTQVVDEVQKNGAVMVLFTAFTPEQAYQTEKELESRWGLRLLI